MRRIDLKRLNIAPLVPTAYISEDYANGWNDLLRKLYGAKEPGTAQMRIRRSTFNCSCSRCCIVVDVTDEYCRRCGAKFKDIKYIKEEGG